MTAFFQNTYAFKMPMGIAGRIADCGFKNTLSPVGLENILPALAVYKPTGVDYQVELPRLSTTTVTFSADLVTGNTVQLSVNGVPMTPIVFATSQQATMTDVQQQLIIQNPGVVQSSVLSGSPYRVITVNAVAGQPLSITGTVTGGASQATISQVQSVDGTFFGVSQYIYNKQALYTSPTSINASVIAQGPAPYFPGEVVPTLTQGRIYVQPETVVNSDSPVYVRIAPSGSNTQVGSFRGDADGGTAVLIPSNIATWREGNGTVGNIAVLELNIP